MKHFYKALGGWFTWPRLYKDMVTKFPSESHFVEVGVYRGTSLCYLIVEMINAEKQFVITGIDSFIEPGSSRDIVKMNLRRVRKKFRVITGDSADTANKAMDKSLDFVFIDAAHDYKSVKKDILAWLPKIKEGGYIAGHDYPGYPGVKKAVDEIFGDLMIKDYVGEFCWLVAI